MRSRLLAVVLPAAGMALAGAAGAAAPAAAQEPVTVEASSFRFTPARVTVAPGQVVRFTNAGGFHNVHFDGEERLFAPAPPEAPVWRAAPAKSFAAPGEYRFICDPHVGQGMVGTVVVQAPAGGPPPAGPPPAGSPPPAPAPPVEPAPAPAPVPPPAPPAPPEQAPAEVRRLELSGTRFCTRRGRTCRRPGIVLRVDLTAPGRLAGRLERRPLERGGRYRPFGRVELGTVPAGPRTVRFARTSAGRRLAPGRYRLRATVDGRAAGILRFEVRAS